MGIGSVKIKTHDGAIKTLTKVTHILELKRNLTSLSTLEANGYEWKAKDRILKVLKGAMVAMKGIRSNGLYLLRGNIVVGGVAMASSEEEKHNTRLWNMKLPYESMRYLHMQ